MCSRGRVKYPPCAQVRIGTKHVYDGNEQGESEVPPVHNFMMAVSMHVQCVSGCWYCCDCCLCSGKVNISEDETTKLGTACQHLMHCC